jgi:hypothetical protein
MRTVRAPAAPVRSRIYEKIIWDSLRAAAYASFAELVEDVKIRCARLRIPYRDHEIDDAIAAMGDKVTRELAPLERGGKTGSDSTVPPLTHDEAVAVLRRLHARPKAVPVVLVLPPEQVDRARAFAMVVQGIREQKAVCAALERQGPERASTNVDQPTANSGDSR